MGFDRKRVHNIKVWKNINSRILNEYDNYDGANLKLNITICNSWKTYRFKIEFLKHFNSRCQSLQFF